MRACAVLRLRCWFLLLFDLGLPCEAVSEDAVVVVKDVGKFGWVVLRLKFLWPDCCYDVWRRRYEIGRVCVQVSAVFGIVNCAHLCAPVRLFANPADSVPLLLVIV